ncbi:MAG: hypothetical protein ACI4DO_00480 [Roseburia sp.]
MKNKIKIRIQELFQFRDKTGEYKVEKIPFVIKSVAVFFVVLLSVGIVSLLAEMVMDEANYSGEDYYLSCCEESYVNRDYSELYDIMNLYNLTTPEYDKYWEMVEGYQDYLLYINYRSILEQGIDQVEFCYTDGEENATTVHFVTEEMVQAYGDKVQENAQNCRFDSNQRYLNEFAEK